MKLAQIIYSLITEKQSSKQIRSNPLLSDKNKNLSNWVYVCMHSNKEKLSRDEAGCRSAQSLHNDTSIKRQHNNATDSL